MKEAYKIVISSFPEGKGDLGCNLVVYSNTNKAGEYPRSEDL
jgi:hypothetical protein